MPFEVSMSKPKKNGRILFLKKVLNMLGTPKCKRPKTSPEFARNKTKMKMFYPNSCPNSPELEKAEIIFLKPARTCMKLKKKFKKLPTLTPNVPWLLNLQKKTSN